MVILIIGMLAGVSSIVSDSAEHTEAQNQGPEAPTPFNISLSFVPVSVSSVSNGTVTLDPGDYTVYAAAKQLEVSQNTTYNGTLTVTYDYKGANFIDSPLVSVLIGFVLILVALGLIYYVYTVSKRE